VDDFSPANRLLIAVEMYVSGAPVSRAAVTTPGSCRWCPGKCHWHQHTRFSLRYWWAEWALFWLLTYL